VPAYLEGRRLGYRIIGVDQRPDALGAALADEFVCVTTRDPAAIVRRLGPVEVAAVISPASDAALASVAALSAHYRTGLRPSPAAVRVSQDKSAFHDLVSRLGFPRYASVRHTDVDALVDAAAAMTYPVVVKPVDSSGSKGLACVRHPADLRTAIVAAFRHSYRGVVRVEELVVGEHYSVECFARGGRPDFMVVTGRTLTPMPEMITVEHQVPAALDAAVERRLRAMLAAVFVELDHRTGPVNVDFVVDATGAVRFVELGARLGGNGIPLLVRHALGVNTIESAIRLAAGETDVDMTPRSRRRLMALRILGAPHEGTLAAVDGLDATRALPGVVDLRVFKTPGEPVHPYTQAGHKLGYVVVAADRRADLRRRVDAALNTLRFVVEPDSAAIRRRTFREASVAS
jgi:biotin carboxylase